MLSLLSFQKRTARSGSFGKPVWLPHALQRTNHLGGSVRPVA